MTSGGPQFPERASIAAGLLLSLLALLFAPGCSAARGMLDSLDKPTARIVDAHLMDLHAQGATIDFDVQIQNPYSVPLPVGALDVALSSGGTAFLSAAGEPGATIPARRSGRVRIPANLNFMEMLTVLESVRPGSIVPYRADVSLGLDIPGGERLTLPLSHEGQVPIPVPPAIAVRALRWDELSLQQARGVLTLDITNPNEFAAAIDALDYALALGGQTVAEASLARPASLDPGGSGTIEIPLAFSTVSLGTTVFQALTRGEISYSLTGDADVGTPFGRILLPVASSGQAPVSR